MLYDLEALACFTHHLSLSQFLVLPPFQKQGHGSKSIVVEPIMDYG